MIVDITDKDRWFRLRPHSHTEWCIFRTQGKVCVQLAGSDSKRETRPVLSAEYERSGDDASGEDSLGIQEAYA